MTGAATLGDLSINLVSFGPRVQVRAAVAACARHGVRAVGVTREQVASVGLAEMRRILDGEGMAVSGYARVPAFPPAHGPGWVEELGDVRRLLDEAHELGAACMLATGGGLVPGSRDVAAARESFAEGLNRLLPLAQSAGVPLAIEPLHPMYAAERGIVSTLGQALDLCDRLGRRVGVAVDVYHVWWDPDLPAAIARAGDLIRAYHICDWRVPTRNLLHDRAMMGDGVIDLAAIGGMVRSAGYTGHHEVEIFSELDWWTRPADDIAATCVERFAQIRCGKPDIDHQKRDRREDKQQ
ncbi:sugar phosphate isomerase/epimerase family protein [Azospirillum endophyticum]